MKLILTRPVAQARDWSAALCSAGHEVQTIPLIDIAVVEDWQVPRDLDAMRALMFVSASAAQYFFNRAATVPTTPRFWGTGAGTAAALLARGVPADQIDVPSEKEGFDSEALWQRVHTQLQAGDEVLILRGRDAGAVQASRSWLIEQIQRVGAVPRILEVYERRRPQWSEEEMASCQRALQNESCWIFSSSLAILNLPAACDVGQAFCLCTHPRIAQTARARGFNNIRVTQPSLAQILASLKSEHE